MGSMCARGQLQCEHGGVDMAVSALSRWVMLKALLPRLKPSARIFVWGFPGSKGAFAGASLSDFNSEKKFAGGFGQAHMNTVGWLPPPSYSLPPSAARRVLSGDGVGTRSGGGGVVETATGACPIASAPTQPGASASWDGVSLTWTASLFFSSPRVSIAWRW